MVLREIQRQDPLPKTWSLFPTHFISVVGNRTGGLLRVAGGRVLPCSPTWTFCAPCVSHKSARSKEWRSIYRLAGWRKGFGPDKNENDAEWNALRAGYLHQTSPPSVGCKRARLLRWWVQSAEPESWYNVVLSARTSATNSQDREKCRESER